jgi:hypothetical protein
MVEKNRLLLKVEFSSALDIARYVSENDYSLGAYTSFCNRLNYEATISSPRVYSRGYLLGRFERDPFRDASTTKTYYLFVEIAQKASPKDIPPREAFDLRQKPEDLCLVLKGGNNSGFGYESNTVTIPSDAIATALRQIPASASAAQSEGASN